MRLLLLYFSVILSFMSSVFGEKYINVSCDDLTNATLFGKVANFLSSSKPFEINVEFFLSTNAHRQMKKLDFASGDIIENIGFNKSAKTFVVIHGYVSSGFNSWIEDLKDNLLDLTSYNVLIVNWDDGSYNPNYVELAQNIGKVSIESIQIFQKMREVLEKYPTTSNEIAWNRLTFVGHSLGAHISGQVAHILKQDTFWQVERITGLDPAKPCFVDVDTSLRLDKGDAEFVDIIHTQIGEDHTPFKSLGIREPLGDVDFYVNGGVLQRVCSRYRLLSKLWTMICSHTYAYRYYTDSLNLSKNCQYASYEWDGTYNGAERIVDSIRNYDACSTCPQMGIHASKSPQNKSAMFLVITGLKAPYCQFRDEDLDYTLDMIKNLEDPIKNLYEASH